MLLCVHWRLYFGVSSERLNGMTGVFPGPVSRRELLLLMKLRIVMLFGDEIIDSVLQCILTEKLLALRLIVQVRSLRGVHIAA